jgi:hypothetical protein
MATVAVGLLAGALVLLMAAPAGASAPCPASTVSTAFAKFGDTASYALVEGGLFESGAPGWTLRKAEIIDESPEQENQRYYWVGNGDRYEQRRGHSLGIDQGGEAVSAPFCVNSEYPSFRFLYKQRWGSGSLDVSLRWTDTHGTHEAADAALVASRSWTITPVLLLAGKLPAGTTPHVRLVFRPTSGSWAIDDVYIDPYRR